MMFDGSEAQLFRFFLFRIYVLNDPSVNSENAALCSCPGTLSSQTQYNKFSMSRIPEVSSLSTPQLVSLLQSKYRIDAKSGMFEFMSSFKICGADFVESDFVDANFDDDGVLSQYRISADDIAQLRAAHTAELSSTSSNRDAINNDNNKNENPTSHEKKADSHTDHQNGTDREQQHDTEHSEQRNDDAHRARDEPRRGDAADDFLVHVTIGRNVPATAADLPSLIKNLEALQESPPPADVPDRDIYYNFFLRGMSPYADPKSFKRDYIRQVLGDPSDLYQFEFEFELMHGAQHYIPTVFITVIGKAARDKVLLAHNHVIQPEFCANSVVHVPGHGCIDKRLTFRNVWVLRTDVRCVRCSPVHFRRTHTFHRPVDDGRHRAEDCPEPPLRATLSGLEAASEALRTAHARRLLPPQHKLIIKEVDTTHLTNRMARPLLAQKIGCEDSLNSIHSCIIEHNRTQGQVPAQKTDSWVFVELAEAKHARALLMLSDTDIFDTGAKSVVVFQHMRIGGRGERRLHDRAPDDRDGFAGRRGPDQHRRQFDDPPHHYQQREQQQQPHGIVNGCFKCGNPDHKSRDCTMRARDGSAFDDPRSCWLCGGAHRVRECPNRSADYGGGRGCWNCGGAHPAQECPKPLPQRGGGAGEQHQRRRDDFGANRGGGGYQEQRGYDGSGGYNNSNNDRRGHFPPPPPMHGSRDQQQYQRYSPHHQQQQQQQGPYGAGRVSGDGYHDDRNIPQLPPPPRLDRYQHAPGNDDNYYGGQQPSEHSYARPLRPAGGGGGGGGYDHQSHHRRDDDPDRSNWGARQQQPQHVQHRRDEPLDNSHGRSVTLSSAGPDDHQSHHHRRRDDDPYRGSGHGGGDRGRGYTTDGGQYSRM